jgi:arsenate reductase (thioredoxin)
VGFGGRKNQTPQAEACATQFHGSSLSAAKFRVILFIRNPGPERKDRMVARTKVLFLCIGNACRSQMAEAIARRSASDVIEPSSAGLVPFGEIPSTTIAVLRERGISADGQTSKPLRAEDISSADIVINMTGRSGATIFKEPSTPVEDWDVGDPYGSNLTVYREIRDQIEKRVEDLARRLREKVDSPDAA